MEDDTRLIPLRNKKGEVIAHAIVDAQDFEELNRYRWCRSNSGYAVRSLPRTSNPRTTLQMHRQILSVPEGAVTDHINRNRLDNRRENLRICTHQENMWNRRMPSGKRDYIGVGPKSGSFQASIDGTYLGLYTSAKEAAQAYDTAARERYGEFAQLNFPKEILLTPKKRIRSAGAAGYYGVGIDKRGFRAVKQINGERTHLGMFATAEEAARAYDAATVNNGGNLDRLNFPLEHQKGAV